MTLHPSIFVCTPTSNDVTARVQQGLATVAKILPKLPTEHFWTVKHRKRDKNTPPPPQKKKPTKGLVGQRCLRCTSLVKLTHGLWHHWSRSHHIHAARGTLKTHAGHALVETSHHSCLASHQALLHPLGSHHSCWNSHHSLRYATSHHSLWWCGPHHSLSHVTCQRSAIPAIQSRARATLCCQLDKGCLAREHSKATDCSYSGMLVRLEACSRH